MADQDERQHRPRGRALVEGVRLVRESELKLTGREDHADARDRRRMPGTAPPISGITAPMSGTGRQSLVNDRFMGHG